jgi:hypothetical protein
MTADPFPGRCSRCGMGLLDDTDRCDRPDCETAIAAVRRAVRATCRRLLAAGRWLGLVE